MTRIKICIDAGHYGKYNRSPANKAYYESDMAWKLHLLQKKYLEQYGFEVILTRSNQATNKGLYDRGATAKGCALFISDHSNASGSGVNDSVDRPVVIVPINGKGDALGKKLAECIHDVMGTTQPGRYYSKQGNSGDYYGVIRGAVAVGSVGMILEHSFHTNTRATNWLLNDSNLDKLARAEARVIAEHYGLTSVSETTETPAPVESQSVKPLSGKVKVIYTGSDGVNVRKAPIMRDEYIDQVVHSGTFTVVGITENGKWYKLKTGLYITTSETYVKFTASNEATVDTAVPFRVKATKSVEIRRGAGENFAKCGYTGTGTFTIVQERNGWGLLKSYQKNASGWICLADVTKV